MRISIMLSLNVGPRRVLKLASGGCKWRRSLDHFEAVIPFGDLSVDPRLMAQAFVSPAGDLDWYRVGEVSLTFDKTRSYVMAGSSSGVARREVEMALEATPN